ncbi:response regulator [bacterium]|nr:MAG: response regulator [bacterium]
MPRRPLNILLVDDDAEDLELMRGALERAARPLRLDSAGNGEQALSILRKEGPYSGAPDPDLILLDLNMPVMDGRQLLRALKRDEAFKRIPVLVLTTSGAEADVAETYGLGANCYITKPAGLAGLYKVADAIEAFWMTAVRLPGV